MEFNEDRYYDALQLQHEDEAKVPFSDYRELEEKYDNLEKAFQTFKENIEWYIQEDKIDELIKYVKGEV